MTDDVLTTALVNYFTMFKVINANSKGRDKSILEMELPVHIKLVYLTKIFRKDI